MLLSKDSTKKAFCAGFDPVGLKSADRPEQCKEALFSLVRKRSPQNFNDVDGFLTHSRC